MSVYLMAVTRQMQLVTNGSTSVFLMAIGSDQLVQLESVWYSAETLVVGEACKASKETAFESS